MLSLNLHRRQLNVAQRAIVAANLANLENGQKASSAKLQSTAVSQADAAKLVGISPRSVATAVKIKKETLPEIVDAVAAGALSLL